MAKTVLLISMMVAALAEALRINPDNGGVPMSLYEAPKTRSGRRNGTQPMLSCFESFTNQNFFSTLF